MLAVELERIAGEALLQDLELLLEDLRSGFPVDAERGEVGGLVADPEPEDHATAAEPVQHQGVLGQPDRWCNGVASTAGPIRIRSVPGRRPAPRSMGDTSGATARLMELGEKHSVEAGRLGRQDLGSQLLPQCIEGRALRLDREDQPELGHFCSRPDLYMPLRSRDSSRSRSHRARSCTIASSSGRPADSSQPWSSARAFR